MKLLNDKNIEKFLPYGFILFGLIVSVSTLTIQPLWFDEHLTMNEAQSRSFKDMMTLVLRHESIPPLFFVLEYFMVKIFSLSTFTLRILPALAGTLGTFFCWKIFLKVTDKLTALMVLILCVCSSFLLNYSQEARPYSIFFFESMLLLFFSIRWLEKHDFKSAIGIVVSMFVAINTHYYALFMNAAVILSLIIAERKPSRHLKGYITFAIAALLSVISVLPWLVEQIALQVSGQKSALIAKAGIAIPFIPISTITGTALTKIVSREDFSGWNAIVLLFLVPVFFFTFRAVLRFFRQRDVLKRTKVIPLFLVLFFLIAYVAHIVTGFRIPSLHPRYTIYFMMLLCGGIVCFTASTKIVRNVVFGILLIINIFGLLANYWGNTTTYRIPWNKIASDIETEIPKVSVVTSGDIMHVFVLPYYMKSDARIALFDKRVFWKTFDAQIYLREPYPFFNRNIEIYQQKFEYYSSEKNKPDTSNSTLVDFLKINSVGIYIYQEDGVPYNEDFLKHSMLGLKLKVLHHYLTNQGIVYIVKWEYSV